MKTLIKIIVSLLCLASPLLAATPGFHYECNGTVCRLVPDSPAPARFYAAPAVVAATPATYRTFAVTPVVAATPAEYVTFAPTPVSLASFSQAVFTSVSPPVVTSSTCDCFQTGICTCDPATCRCPNCLDGMANLTKAMQVSTSTPYTYFSVGAPTVMQAAPSNAASYMTPRGPLTAYVCEHGVLYVNHQGGSYARRMTRHLNKGWNRFGIAP